MIGAGLMLGPQKEADASFFSDFEFSYGDASKGFYTHPIYRAGAVPFDFTVLPTPGNCGNAIQVSVGWDEDDNYVRVHIKGKNVLDKLPSIRRTEGVDYFFNPFQPEPKDYDNGRYTLWIVTSPGTGNWFYDPMTLDLVGSEFDLEPEQTVGLIPVNIPYFVAIPSPFFQPDENGDIDMVYEYDYDALVRPDLPDQTHTVGTFLPHSLCQADPFRYDRTAARSHLIPQDASNALSWRDYWENGIIYDLTVEPPEYFTNPPTATNVGVYQGAIGVAGGIPKGQTLSFASFFGGTAPPLEHLPTAPGPGESCTQYYKPINPNAINICGPPGGGGPPGGPPPGGGAP